MGLLNYTEADQAVVVRLLRETGGPLAQTVPVGARTRRGIDVGALFGLTGDVAFGVEVACDACAASLVMWDTAYTVPAISAPIRGCR